MYRNENRVIEDSFGAFLVSGANFTTTEEYPIIEKEMVSDTPPLKMMPFDKALNYQGDLKDYYICTYARDITFERVRRNPQKYVHFFQRCAGIIGFDYSIHSDMPIIKQKAQMYDNLALTYYYGSLGIPVIPNLRCGVDELMPEFFEAIPKDSLVAVGTHGFIKEIPQKAEWYCFLDSVIKKLRPKGIVVYGRLSGHVFDELSGRCQFYYYEPWIYSNRRREVRSNVN